MHEPHDTLAADPVLGPLVEEHGPLRVEAADDPFKRLVVSIIRQQVSMEAGRAIRERLFDAVAIEPDALAAADPAVLQDAGLSASKAESMRALAQTWGDQDWGPEAFVDLYNEGVRDALTDVHGIGPWTANMFLMFGLGRPDVFPVGDLGIRQGMRTLFDEDLTRGEMRDRAERWAPHRSTAARYVWRVADE
jgi:DNA-3-methyladenine glycosylase II